MREDTNNKDMDTAKALLSEGSSFYARGRWEMALAAHDEVIRKFEDTKDPLLREQVAKAFLGKQAILRNIGRMEESFNI